MSKAFSSLQKSLEEAKLRRLCLFGRISWDGERLPWQRPLALLAFLACSPTWHSRARAAEWLRPEASSASALAYLRRTLHRLRESLPNLPIQLEEHRIRWAGISDLSEFENALAERDWQRAIELQPEPLLADVRFDQDQPTDAWFVGERQRLTAKLAGAIISLVPQLQEGADADCTDLFDRLVGLDPLNEMNVRFVLQRARTPMERVRAAEAFETLDRRLRTELGVKAHTDTRDLADKARLSTLVHYARAATSCTEMTQSANAAASQGHQGRPSAAGVAGPASPLGREEEMARVLELLQSGDAPLVTISGPGGVGKSFLARAVYQGLQASRQIAVYWIDLHACHNRQELAATLAAQLEVPGGIGTVEDRLAQWLAQRSGVAILDNFEQLVDHGSLVAGLLRRAPGMRFLVTSRERLGLQEEALVRLQGLDFEAADSSAVKLFLRHAARLGHPIPAEHYEDVVRLARHVEGLPLAIELAVHWVPLLNARQIVEELERDAMFADGLAAHDSARTIRSVLESTWSRLALDERRALISLAVVSAPMALGTASAVVGTQDAAVFRRLVSKSLLSRTAAGRMKLHNLIKEFALRQAEGGELREARLRHAQHFLGRLARQPVPRFGQHAPERMQEMREDADDLILAFRFAVDADMLDFVASATPALGFFLARTSQPEIGIALTQYALSRFGEGEPKLSLLRAMGCVAIQKTGRHVEAAIACERAVHDIREGAPRAWLALCRSWIARAQGDYQCSLEELTHALHVLGREDAYLEILLRQEVASTLVLCGKFRIAYDQLCEVRAMAQLHQAPLYEARALAELGAILSLMGQASLARGLLVESLRLGELVQDLPQVASAERQLSYVSMQLGQLDDQLQFASSSLERFKSAGVHYELGESEVAVALAFMRQGRTQEGQECARRAIAVSRQLDCVPTLLRAVFLLGHSMLAGDRQWGLAVMRFAMTHAGRRKTDLAFARQLWALAGATAEERSEARRIARTFNMEVLLSSLESKR